MNPCRDRTWYKSWQWKALRLRSSTMVTPRWYVLPDIELHLRSCDILQLGTPLASYSIKNVEKPFLCTHHTISNFLKTFFNVTFHQVEVRQNLIFVSQWKRRMLMTFQLNSTSPQTRVQKTGNLDKNEISCGESKGFFLRGGGPLCSLSQDLLVIPYGPMRRARNLNKKRWRRNLKNGRENMLGWKKK